MDEKHKDIINHLFELQMPSSGDISRISNIGSILKAARYLSGRNLETGIYEMNELTINNVLVGLIHPFQFAGVMCYLILLEQIGTIFRFINEPSCHNNKGIICALKKFSNLNDEKKTKSIDALRNSLTHRFGLATEKKQNKPDKSDKSDKQYKFILSIERNKGIVKLPISPWLGDFSDKSEDTSTTIYMIDFADMVEQIIDKVKNEINLENLELKLKDGVDELYARYTCIF